MGSWINPDEARGLAGLRLVLTVGVPGPWSEGARGVLHARGVEYTCVRQIGGQPNPDLVAWTGESNAPQAVYQDERARTGWAEILFLAERLGRGPSLIPDDAQERALMMGLAREICGEQGLGWSLRLNMLAPMMELPEFTNRPLPAEASTDATMPCALPRP